MIYCCHKWWEHHFYNRGMWWLQFWFSAQDYVRQRMLLYPNIKETNHIFLMCQKWIGNSIAVDPIPSDCQFLLYPQILFNRLKEHWYQFPPSLKGPGCVLASPIMRFVSTVMSPGKGKQYIKSESTRMTHFRSSAVVFWLQEQLLYL